ncbi:MAG: ROK family protein, partial [Candidatus Aegiribacteria sp.]|nr:ROK family protein [Candidatus Aegiribacteria sp.]
MSNPSGKHWGIDIGGTTTILGYLVIDAFKTISTIQTIPSEGPEKLLTRIRRTISNIDDSPRSIGAGIAGLVDRKNGILIRSPNLINWVRFPLQEKLINMFRCPVVIDNDCNTFAIRAIDSGEIPSDGLSLLITLGTGIGGTIIHNGTILYGTGHAGEFGHMTVNVSGESCPCGSRGCWERYAAAEALVRYFKLTGSDSKNTDPRKIAQLAKTGNENALKAFEEFGEWVGVGLANLSHCLSPSGIYLAGGLVNTFSLFIEHARREFNRRCPYEWNVSALSSCSD